MAERSGPLAGMLPPHALVDGRRKQSTPDCMPGVRKRGDVDAEGVMYQVRSYLAAFPARGNVSPGRRCMCNTGVVWVNFTPRLSVRVSGGVALFTLAATTSCHYFSFRRVDLVSPDCGHGGRDVALRGIPFADLPCPTVIRRRP